MVDKPELENEEKLTEMRETITSLQTELDKVKVELSEIKGGKIVMAPVLGKTEEEQAPETEPEEDTQEIVIEHLKKIPGVGAVMAAKIYEAGLTTRAQLKDATVESFTEIPGIGPSMAAKIVDSLKKIEEGKEAELTSKEAEPAQPEGPGITDKAVDFIKGTVTKIKGFLVKSPPEKKEGEGASAETPEQSVEVTGATGEDESKPIEYPPPTKEEVIEAYAKIDGIDTELATKLYEVGYSTLGELKEAETEDLVLIEGISKEQAEKISEGLKNA
jgi:ERCC4-type nuclease